MLSEGFSHRGKLNLFGLFARVQLQFVMENRVAEQNYKASLTHQGSDAGAAQRNVGSAAGTLAPCPSGFGVGIVPAGPRKSDLDSLETGPNLEPSLVSCNPERVFAVVTG